MKYLLVSLLALGVGTAAVAAPDASAPAPLAPPARYPPCSKTVTDECMQAQPHYGHHMARHMKHHRAHHQATQPAQTPG